MLKPSIASLEEVEESLRGEYKEVDGSFILDVEGGFKPLTEFQKIQGALTKEKANHFKTTGMLTNYGDHTPESILEMQNTIAANELKGKKGDSDDVVNEKVEKLLKIKMTPLEATNKTLTTSLEESKATILNFETKEATQRLKTRVDSVIDDKDSKYLSTSKKDIYNAAVMAGFEYNEDVKGFINKDSETFDTWLPKESNGRWDKGSQGANADGGGGNSDGSGTMTATEIMEDVWNKK